LDHRNQCAQDQQPGQQVRFISVAQPELAPYGQATIEVLKDSHLWDALQPQVVYANSISQAKQLAVSGNADAAFTAYSLGLHDGGTVVKIDRRLYPSDRLGDCDCASSPRIEEAKKVPVVSPRPGRPDDPGGERIFAALELVGSTPASWSQLYNAIFVREKGSVSVLYLEARHLYRSSV
jgi:hypothetical protein